MNKIVISTLLAASIFSIGCSSIKDVFTKPTPAFLSYEEGIEQINKAEVCCSNDLFSAKQISVVKNTDEEYWWDLENSQAYNFPTGKSFFKIFALPLNAYSLAITFDVLISTTTFKPQVDFYNKDKQLVATMKPNAFKYRDSMGGDGKLQAKFYVNNSSAAQGKEFAYMVVYTTDDAIKQTTSVVHPAVRQAIILNKAVPKFDNVKIKHSPIGLINIIFNFRQLGDVNNDSESLFDYLDKPLLGGAESDNRTENVVLANGTVYSPSSQTINSTEVKSIDSKGNELPNGAVSNGVHSSSINAESTTSVIVDNSSNVNQQAQTNVKMLEETEKMYNELIKKAVAADDLEKAMLLVAEAQRNGSLTAQRTFIDAVKNIKK